MNTTTDRAAAPMRLGLHFWCHVRNEMWPWVSCRRIPYAICGYKNMALHLQEISQAVPPVWHAFVIRDQEGWHTTLKLPQLANITLLLLPAGSPALNLAEQVWQQMPERSLANRRYDSYDDIVDACCDGWNKFPRSLVPSDRCAAKRARLTSELDMNDIGSVSAWNYRHPAPTIQNQVVLRSHCHLNDAACRCALVLPF